VQILDDDVR
jgi:SAM-dependent MidA family methyltransferase